MLRAAMMMIMTMMTRMMFLMMMSMVINGDADVHADDQCSAGTRVGDDEHQKIRVNLP